MAKHAATVNHCADEMYDMRAELRFGVAEDRGLTGVRWFKIALEAWRRARNVEEHSVCIQRVVHAMKKSRHCCTAYISPPSPARADPGMTFWS